MKDTFIDKYFLTLIGIALIVFDLWFAWFFNSSLLRNIDSKNIIPFNSYTFIYEVLLTAILFPLIEEVVYRGHLVYKSLEFHRAQLLVTIISAVIWFLSYSRNITNLSVDVFVHVILLGSTFSILFYAFTHYFYALRKGATFPYMINILVILFLFVFSHQSLWYIIDFEGLLIKLTLSGLIYTYLTYYLGLRYAILAHMLSNGVVLLYLLQRGVYSSIW